MRFKHSINVVLDTTESSTIYCFGFIGEVLGIKLNFIENFDQSDSFLYYGTKTELAESSNLWINQSYDNSWQSIFSNSIGDDISNNSIFKFDVISALKILLNANFQLNEPNHLDEHNRLLFSKSIQYGSRYESQPVINKLIGELKNKIEKSFKININNRWPNNKKAVVILSHDVDVPEKFAYLSKFKFLKRNISINKRKNFLHKHLAGLKEKYLYGNLDNNWLFNEIIEEESKHGFKSTFFFSAIDSSFDYSHYLDVDYDISSKKFKDLFKVLNTSNFEIGLHSSFNCHKKKSHGEYEKERLEHFADRKILGLRHHFWNLGPNPTQTLTYHSENGFKYDSSLAFNDHPGFRNNVALPFFIYDFKSNANTNILQIPPFCMDSNLMNIENPLLAFKKHLSILIENEGVGSIDWHVRTSVPEKNEFSKWGKLYFDILDELSNNDDVWVTSFEEFINWYQGKS